jgi:DNA-binding LacI/PurR family transcriptional regulator
MSDTHPTIYDVARLAGVSISTVSRALNAPHKVNERTLITVMNVIDQLDFVPKAESRARALSSTGRIGVITPFFTSPSFVQRLRCVAAALATTNYELVIYTVDSQARLNGYLETIPLSRNLDGLVVMSLRFPDSLAQRLVKYGLPTVLIEYPQRILSSVEIDDIGGGKMAAEYLLKKGHRQCAFLGDTDLPEYGIHPITQRLVGYREELQEAGIPLPDEYVRLVPYDLETTRRFTRELLNTPNPPTALFAATDLQAMGVLKAARDLGIQVPQDLAIIGFDDLDMADYIGLTTIRQHLDESGRIAVELLLSHIQNPGRTHQHIHLPLKLIERETA